VDGRVSLTEPYLKGERGSRLVILPVVAGAAERTITRVNADRSWLIATRVAGWVVGFLFLILLATGIALTFRYRPTVSGAYSNVTSAPRAPIFTARRVHRVASELFVPAVGCLAIASTGVFLVRRDRLPVALALVAAASALTAAVIGYLLPWDQLSVSTVRAGTNLQGYMPILGDHNVKYVIFGSSEVTTATVGHWFWLHALMVPLVIVAVVTALLTRAQRSVRRVGVADDPSA
jgi:cytochrome b6